MSEEIEIIKKQLSIAIQWIEHTGFSTMGVWHCLEQGGICGKCEIMNLEKLKGKSK